MVLCPSRARVAEVDDGSWEGFGSMGVLGMTKPRSAANAASGSSKLERNGKRIFEARVWEYYNKIVRGLHVNTSE